MVYNLDNKRTISVIFERMDTTMRKLHTKRIAAALSAILLSASLLALPASAGVTQKSAPDASKLPAGTLIYSETFDGTAADTDAALKQLGWTKAEGLRKFTMKLSISDGKLHVDNLDSSSEDSYALMMDSAYLSKLCNADYTYEYDVTYLDAGNNSRYVSLLCNYDGKDKYNTVDMRIRGDGYNQVRIGDSWIHYNDTTCPLRATNDTAIITQLFGEKFQDNGMLLKNKTVKVRVETSIKNGPTVYVNGIKASDMQANKDKWNTIDSYAICFKASKLIKADIDNIRIWTGCSEKPLDVKKPATGTAAATSDLSLIVSASALVLASAAITIARKKK